MVCPGDYETELFFKCDGEEDSVTLQVGMMARDGILLVGDVWTYANVSTVRAAEGGTPVWAGESVSKMTTNKDGDIAISWAQDIAQAQLVADAIARGLTSQYWENPEREIEQIAAAALSSETLGRGVDCLVALRGPTFSLFKLVCRKDPPKENVFHCLRANGQIFAGDCHNPATFWATRYLLADPEQNPTIDELLPLAVQTIADAWQITRGNIRGLEIIRGDGEGFHRLPVKQCKAWAAEAARRSRAIEKIVMAPLSFQ